jgi:hypothetical protein
MAYDANGNFYLDPNDYEDVERYNKVVEDEKIRKVALQQQKAVQTNQEVSSMWEETLKDEGLDSQAYIELLEHDPNLARDLMKTGMKHLASGIKRGRDVKTGQFVPGRSVQQRREQPQESARLDEIREKVKSGGRLSSTDEEDVIDAIFGRLI